MLSQNYPTLPNLYCNEAAGDVVSSDADICKNVDPVSLDSLIEDESSMVCLFDSELDQMLAIDLPRQFEKLPEVVTARQEAVKWMLTVHGYYQFRPETACLSVNYLDRFLWSNTLQQGKGWPLQLLAVACLSLAAKMEETSVPLLFDMQIFEPKFLFESKTVQRMELLVMARLKWQLRIITPFDFVHYFISKLSCFGSQIDQDNHCVYSRASRIILSTCEGNFLDYPPSTIAAAAVLCVTNQTVDDQNLGCFHKRVNKDKVRRCHNLIKQTMSQSTHIKQQMLKPVPPGSINVLDPAVGRSCDAQKDLKSSQDSFQISAENWNNY